MRLPGMAARLGLWLCLLIDRNNAQVDGPTDLVMNLEPLADKWRAFGWRVEEIDGHDFGQILGFLQRSRKARGRPSAAVARTRKGRGVSFVENGNRYLGQRKNVNVTKVLQTAAGRMIFARPED